MTNADFLAHFPEFAAAGTTLLTTTIAAAELQVSDSFGDQRPRALACRAADMLAKSPWGRDARMVVVGKGGDISSSTYAIEFDRLAEANGVTATRLGSRCR